MRIYAWMAPDRDGDDGLLTIQTPIGLSSAAFARKDLAERFRDQAQGRADTLGVSVRLAVLEEVDVVDIINPRGNN